MSNRGVPPILVVPPILFGGGARLNTARAEPARRRPLRSSCALSIHLGTPVRRFADRRAGRWSVGDHPIAGHGAAGVEANDEPIAVDAEQRLPFRP